MERKEELNTFSFFCKLSFKVTKTSNQFPVNEVVFGKKIGDNLYKIHNSPFFTFGYSYLDIVVTENNSEYPYPLIIYKNQESGHSTYRILRNPNIHFDVFNKFWLILEKMGCSYESDDKLLSYEHPIKYRYQ